MIWDQLTSPKLAALDRAIPVFLPIAATEQHGPHLPVAADRLIGEHFMRRLNERLPDEVLILPPVSVGCSEHHMEFVGTLTLTHATFIAQVTEILESVAAHGFTNLILSNSHGGNVGAMTVIMEAFGRRHPACRVVWWSWWNLAAQRLLDLNETGPGGIGHACEFETSLMMLIAPALVDMRAIVKGGNLPTFDWATSDLIRRSPAGLYRTMQAMTGNGVYGDPTAATAEKGEKITALVVDDMARIARELKGTG